MELRGRRFDHYTTQLFVFVCHLMFIFLTKYGLVLFLFPNSLNEPEGRRLRNLEPAPHHRKSYGNGGVARWLRWKNG